MSIRNKLYLLSESDQKDKWLNMPLSTPSRPILQKTNVNTPTAPATTTMKPHPDSEKKSTLGLKRQLSSSSALSGNGTTAAPGTAALKKAKPVRCITHSERMVKATRSKYRPFFTPSLDEGTDSPRSSPLKDDHVCRLEYPGTGDYENFLLLKPVTLNARQDDVEDDNDEYHPVNDIYQTAFWIYDCYLTPSQQERLGDASQGIMRNLTKYRNRRNGPGFAQAVDAFNKVIKEFKLSGDIHKNAKEMRHPSYDLTCHILYQVYSRTVAHQADALNNYQGKNKPTIV
ncbi:hypothetical protein [Absidia glauca]|uniref:DOT1 domain-containing protein n=1 Tax=Absidia glauca TaxID=4829 RepID=A0A163JSW3_ABSGL|nr:hypothetical protein [Absidia glauca]